MRKNGKESGKQWKGTTFGSEWLLSSLVAALRHVDVMVFYVFAAVCVVPVCLLVNPSRGVIYRYFRRRWNLSPLRAAWQTYVCHCLFSQVVVDKFAMYAGRKFEVETVGYEHFLRLDAEDDGFVQLSSHVGNYEIAGYTLVAKGKRMNAVVFAGEKAAVMQNRQRMFSDTNIRIIPASDDMSHLFAINSALADGEIVSMPADRKTGSQKVVTLDFLGAKADFPLGPFSVAVSRGVDAIAVNVMKTARRKYTVFVTPLAYDRTAPRDEQARQLATAYKNELERMLGKYPTQWYNFFEFWR